MEKQIIEGKWKPFNGRNNPVFGVLQVEEGRIYLEVKNHLSRGRHRDFEALQWKPEVLTEIRGVAGDTFIVLLGCVYDSYNAKGGVATTKIRAARALIGHSSAKNPDLLYQSIELWPSEFHEWTFRSSIGWTETKDGDRALCLKPLPILKFKLNDFVSWSICSSYSIENKRSSWTLSDDESILIEFSKSMDLDAIIENYELPFVRLFSLLTGRAVVVKKAELKTGRNKNGIEFPDRLFRREKRSLQIGNSYLFSLLPFKDISARLEHIAQKWFSVHERLRSVITLYFAVRENADLFLNQRFLFLAQAAEVYHQYSPNFHATVESPAAFKAKIKNVVQIAPIEQQEWFYEKLHYANNKTLAEKLADLVLAHNVPLKRLVPDFQQFSKKVKDTRNYHTHFDENLRLKGKVAEGAELAHLCDVLEALLTICLFDELGLTEEVAPRVVSGYSGRKWISTKRNARP